MSNGTHYPFYLGGLAASVSGACTHPLDVAKVRLQTSNGGSMFGILIESVKRDGIAKGAYPGLSASLLRQMTYSLTRFGAYDPIKQALRSKNDHVLPAWKMALAAALAGTAGGTVGNGADVILVRMIGDVNRAPAERFQYSNCFHGLYRIVTTEGVGALFRGLGPNVSRAALMNTSQLATYDYFKALILKIGIYDHDGMPLHFTSSFFAGTFATTVCSPFDVIKSRVMNAAAGSQAGLVGTIKQSFKDEGFKWMFRGWMPAWIRLSPNTIILFVTLEQMKSFVDYLRGTPRHDIEDHH